MQQITSLNAITKTVSPVMLSRTLEKIVGPTLYIEISLIGKNLSMTQDCKPI